MAWFYAFYGLCLALGAMLIAVDVLTGGAADSSNADADLDGDGDADGDSAFVVLAWIGVGKIPLSVLVYSMLMSTGGFGFLFMGILMPIGVWWVSPLPTILAAVGATRYLGAAMMYLAPPEGNLAHEPSKWLGSAAVVTSRLGPGYHGEVKLLDQDRPIYLPAISDADCSNGEEVIVMNYDKDTNVYVIQRR